MENTKKKILPIYKKWCLGLICIITLSVFISGCSNSSQSSSGTESDNSSSTSDTSTEQKQQINEATEQPQSNSQEQKVDSLNLSLGQSYNDNGVLITIESVEDSGNVTNIKVKIENKNSTEYSTAMTDYAVWDTNNNKLSFHSPYNEKFLYGLTKVKPNETFTDNIVVLKSSIGYIGYSKSSDIKNPTAKWKVSKTQEMPAAKSSEALKISDKARTKFKALLPYPETVEFPMAIFDQGIIGDKYYEMGTLKYKNSVKNKVEGKYKIWYTTDGVLTVAELDGKALI